MILNGLFYLHTRETTATVDILSKRSKTSPGLYWPIKTRSHSSSSDYRRENTVNFAISGLTRNPVQTSNGMLGTLLNTGFRGIKLILFNRQTNKLQINNRNPRTMITGHNGLRAFFYHSNLARTELASLRLLDGIADNNMIQPF